MFKLLICLQYSQPVFVREEIEQEYCWTVFRKMRNQAPHHNLYYHPKNAVTLQL